MTVIRNRGGDIVTKEEMIKDRWAEYFHELLNEGNKGDPLTQATSTEGPVLDEQMEEVRKEIKMKARKAGKAGGI